MSTALLPPPQTQSRRETIADLVERLGDIPLDRIRLQPPPGTATEADVLRIHQQERVLCELVDGVLVEKPMSYRESALAFWLGSILIGFVRPRNLGIVTGEAGMMRFFPGLVRIPDVAFASWDRFPDRRMPTAPIPQLVPDLAVEILSPSNTDKEIERKLGEYFKAGVRLVWIVDPDQRTVDVHVSPEDPVTLKVGDTLDGGDVLPGFQLPVQDLFAELDRQGA